MANTKEHISIRLPKDVLDRLRAKAKREDRSLAWVITEPLRASVGLLPTTPCPQCGDPLSEHTNGGFTCPNESAPAYIEVTPEQLKAHRKAMEQEPLGSGPLCPDCSGLKGLHQKGCKAKQQRRSP